MRNFFLCLALLLLALPARAQDAAGSGFGSGWLRGAPGPWATSARTSYVYLGHAERPTGGMGITAEVSRSWALTDDTSATAGAELESFGFDAGGRWAAILGGLVGTIRTRTVFRPVFLGAGLHLDAGRLPTCSSWGLCLNNAGLFPALSASVRYEPSPRVAFELSGAVRWVNTLAYAGAGGEGGFSGVVRF